MSDTETRSPHLSDGEIDAYSRGALPEAAEARVERHYLACESCHERVRFTRDLVTSLADLRAEKPTPSRRRAWQAVAALLIVGGLVAGWQLAQRAAPVPTGETSEDRAAEQPEVVARLAPPTRDGEIAMVDVPAVNRSIRLVIDAREGGAPGTRFEVTIALTGGGPIFHASDLISSPTGELEVEIGGDRLRAGTYSLEARAEGATISLLFRVRE